MGSLMMYSQQLTHFLKPSRKSFSLWPNNARIFFERQGIIANFALPRQQWGLHYSSKKATLSQACAAQKGALMPPRSLTARSLTRMNGHSKHLFQTYVFDLFVFLC
jgi:hypothetical protein